MIKSRCKQHERRLFGSWQAGRMFVHCVLRLICARCIRTAALPARVFVVRPNRDVNNMWIVCLAVVSALVLVFFLAVVSALLLFSAGCAGVPQAAC